MLLAQSGVQLEMTEYSRNVQRSKNGLVIDEYFALLLPFYSTTFLTHIHTFVHNPICGLVLIRLNADATDSERGLLIRE